MEKSRILMVTSETVPLAKSGGLADMVGALSKELATQGQDVRIVLPRYYSISRENTENLGSISVTMGHGEEWCQILKTELPGTSIPIYLIDHETLFGRDGIYGPTPSEAFQDNGLRFAFFSASVFQLCRKLEWIPDVLHCHDWVSGPVPMLLNVREKHQGFQRTSSVFTIHNLGYQGIFGLEEAGHFPIPLKDIAEHYGIHNSCLNYLKMGIENAQILTTVSPTYAEEIKTALFGHGLDGSLRYREHDLFGVINGMDYSEWNPEKDEYLKPLNFSTLRMRNKEKLKKQIQHQAGLEVNPAVPLFAMVTRLVDQKGIGELMGPTYGKLYQMCWDMDLQFIVVGTGETWCEKELKKLDHALENFKAYITYSNKLAHQLEGAADFFLMPSKYEPCGLNQLYSLRYGTLPIVRKTGGLADTVKPYDQTTGEGTGFLFEDLTPQSIYDTVGWAVSTWYDRPRHIKKMRQRAMKERFSWNQSALKYREIYQWSQDRIKTL